MCIRDRAEAEPGLVSDADVAEVEQAPTAGVETPPEPQDAAIVEVQQEESQADAPAETSVADGDGAEPAAEAALGEDPAPTVEAAPDDEAPSGDEQPAANGGPAAAELSAETAQQD